MKKIIIGVGAVAALTSLFGYWLFWTAVDSVGRAVENLGDLSPSEDWTWDDWDEWDGSR